MGWTVVGLAITVAGIVCAVVAYVQTLHEHDPGRPFWPWWTRKRRAVIGFVVRAWRWLWNRPANQVVMAGAAFGGTAAMGTVTVVATGPEVPPELRVEEQVRLLVARVEAAERQAEADRNRANEAVQAVRSDVAAQGQRLDEADRRIDAKATSIAIGTARLQILGLVLVGFGTVLMAVPAFLPSSPTQAQVVPTVTAPATGGTAPPSSVHG